MARYKPIADYGVTGDLHLLALVGLDGARDRCALSRSARPDGAGSGRGIRETPARPGRPREEG